MIKILLSLIPSEGMRLNGEEPSDFLDVAKDVCFSINGPVRYEFDVSFVKNDVIVKGCVEMDLKCTCGKCLKPYNLKIRNDDVCHFYEKPYKNEIDLTEDIREDILIGFPYKFECSPNCKGICFKCGQDLNEKKCSCLKRKKDKNTVWNELDKLEK